MFRRPQIDLLGHGEEKTSSSSSRGLPDLIHFNAIHNPQHRFCLQYDTDLETQSITFLGLAHAVERCCKWIVSNIEGAHPARQRADGSLEKSRPVALFMESDVSLFIHLAALLTLNVPCVLLSIRLSPNAIVHLLERTRSEAIIVSDRTRPNVQNALAQTKFSSTSITCAASANEFLCSTESTSKALPLDIPLNTRPLSPEDDCNVLILHSSGTTGLPKPIPLGHRYLLGYAACHLFPEADDESCKGINFSTLPLFHGFGLLAPCLALSVGKTFCLPPSSKIPTGSLSATMIRQSNAITCLMTVPTILEEITLLEDFDELAGSSLKALDFVAVGGGAINPVVGEKLHSRGVTLLNHFGATELGALAPIFRPEDDYDYRYLRLRTDLGLRLERLDSDNALICKLIGHPFAWDQEFELQDRLQANPLKPQSEVRILGRNDDLIVLATGEKVLPYQTEGALVQHPLIRRAVVFGNGQVEVGVIIEPASSLVESQDAFVETIWPAILKANSLVDGHACINSKALVLVKPEGKDIPLSDKGSIQRKETYATFDAEIRSIYEKVTMESDDAAVTLDMYDPRPGIRMIVQKCLPAYCRESNWGDEDDFIHLGMDSLQATRLRRILNASIRMSQLETCVLSDLPWSFIYTHPSVSRLVQALINQSTTTVTDDSSEQQTMIDLSSKYSFISPPPKEKDITVLLTGSTGNLGAHLLHVLSGSPLISRIICLARLSNHPLDSCTSALESRQRSIFDARGIVLPPEAWSKIEFLKWTPGADLLGLDAESHHQLASQVTHIFHGAWPMDFKRKLLSFEPQIKALRDILDLAVSASKLHPDRRVKVVLASSIAVVGRYGVDKSLALVPEEQLNDPMTATPMGYAQAKWVCEKIMESVHAALPNQVQTHIIRIGQVSGSRTNGFWNSAEHFPVLVKASQVIGKMPDLRGTLSWLPVDQTAQTCAEILLNQALTDRLLNLENPIRQPWTDICTIIERTSGLSHKRLPFQEWLIEAQKKGGLSENLVEFFQSDFLRMSGGGLVLDTEKCRAASRSLRSTSAVRQETVEKYLEMWIKMGFLQRTT